MNKNYKNEYFIAVVGLTPQILTEALYYYYHPSYKEKRYFDTIRAITTKTGKEKIKEELFDNKWMMKLKNEVDYNIPFSMDDVIEIKDTGKPLEDLRTTKQNIKTIKVIFDEVRVFTTDHQARLTATLAGGRKTMSAIMALSFQLYGRKQDELIHVMVPEEKMSYDPAEDNKWFFPTNPNNIDEKIEISELPVLKVGRYFPIDKSLPPLDLFNKLQEKLDKAYSIKELYIEKNTFSTPTDRLKLSPELAAYLRFFIKKRSNSNCDKNCPGCKQCYTNREQMVQACKNEILQEHRAITNKYDGYYLKAKKAIESDSREYLLNRISEKISRLIKEIKKSNNSYEFREAINIDKQYLNENDNKEVWYGLKIDPGVVKFKD